MSSQALQDNTIMVDSESKLVSFLDDVANLPSQVPAFFLDLEGISLGRYGSISIISLFVAPKSTVYLIDVHSLGGAAFSTKNSTQTSLKSILESPTVWKVIFDIRNDSDALFSHFQISVNGIKDLQLMELATRLHSKRFVAGLAKCIDKDSAIPYSAKGEWRGIKDAGVQLFAPEKGGRYEVFNERPLRPELVAYCAQDVTLLPGLYDLYNSRLSQLSMRSWPAHVATATTQRIVESQSRTYNPNGANKARGPWGG